MRNNPAPFCLLFLFCFAAAAVFSFVPPRSAAAAAAGVKIMEKEGIGRYLADGKGISLYAYARDEKNVSNCIEGCAVNWPPFHADSAAVSDDLDPGDFSVIKRSDGREQTTYKGLPLYYFKNDQYPGDTFGQGLGKVWSLVTP